MYCNVLGVVRKVYRPPGGQGMWQNKALC